MYNDLREFMCSARTPEEQEFQLRPLSADLIKAGVQFKLNYASTVEEETAEKLDALVREIKNTMPIPGTQGRRSLAQWGGRAGRPTHLRVSQHIYEAVRDKRFNGQLEHDSLVIVPNTRKLPNDRDPNFDPYALSFLIATRLHSTGHKNFNHILTDGTFFVIKPDYSFGSEPQTHYVGLGYVERIGKRNRGNLGSIDDLISASAARSYQARSEALRRRPVQGGLPSLGKGS